MDSPIKGDHDPATVEFTPDLPKPVLRENALKRFFVKNEDLGPELEGIIEYELRARIRRMLSISPSDDYF